MRLLDRLTGTVDESRYGMDDWIGWLNDLNSPWSIPGQVIQTWAPQPKTEAPNNAYQGHSARFTSNGPVYTLMAIRLRLFSQVRWAFQQLRSGKPGELFSTGALDLVNLDPWLNAWMIRDVDLAGNFYGYIEAGQVYRLRPDWVYVLLDENADAYDTEPIGYAYLRGGPSQTKLEDAEVFPATRIIHWMPEPDPYARYRGMSWLTPVVREIASDAKMVAHKESYLDNAATPNMVVKFDKDTSFEAFTKFKDAFRLEHEGAANAYRTLFLGGGADTTVVGSDFRQLDFTAVSGKGETRLANAAGIHPVVAGFSEGMQGSSLNAGNFSQARRSTADVLLHPLWVSAAGAIGKVLNPGSGARMWYDARDIPFLREDAKDDAEIREKDATTIRTLVDAGFDPPTVIEAVRTGDWSRLVHTGFVSVQLQEPGAQAQPALNGA